MKNFRENGILSWGRMVGLLVAVIAAAGLFAFAAVSVLAQDNPDRVVIGEDLTIEKGEVVQGTVNVTNGDLEVLGEVRGDAIVVQGDASIEGDVKGDVVVTGGNVELGAESVVEGNVLSLGGEIERKKGAVVHGTVGPPRLPLDGLTQSILPPDALDAHSSPFAPTGVFGNMISLFGKGLFSLVLLVLGLGLAAIIPSRVSVSSATLEAEPMPSLMVGLIIAFLLFPVVGLVSFVLFISLVGWLLIPVLAIGLLVGLLLGLVAVSAWIGRIVYDGTHIASSAPGNYLFVQVLIGMSIVLGTTFVPTVVLPNAVTALMMMLLYFASCVGIASAILSKFGTLVPPKHLHHYHRVYAQATPTRHHPSTHETSASSFQQPAPSDSSAAVPKDPMSPAV